MRKNKLISPHNLSYLYHLGVVLKYDPYVLIMKKINDMIFVVDAIETSMQAVIK